VVYDNFISLQFDCLFSLILTSIERPRYNQGKRLHHTGGQPHGGETLGIRTGQGAARRETGAQYILGQTVRAGRRAAAPGAGGHAFRIGGHTCEPVVAKKGGRYSYDFLIDGASSAPEQYAKEMAEAQTSERIQGMRRAAILIFLALGAAGMWFNWYWAHTRGYFYDKIALLTPALLFLAVYWIFVPKDYAAQFSGISARMWVVILLAFLLGFANMYALRNGLY
jgi:hypothetical protein